MNIKYQIDSKSISSKEFDIKFAFQCALLCLYSIIVILYLSGCAPKTNEVNTTPTLSQLALTDTTINAWRYNALKNQIYFLNSQNQSIDIIDVSNQSIVDQHKLEDESDILFLDLSPNHNTLAICYKREQDYYISLTDISGQLTALTVTNEFKTRNTVTNLALGNNNDVYINFIDENNLLRLSKLDYNDNPPTQHNFERVNLNILSINHDGTSLFTLTNTILGDNTTQWSIQEQTPSTLTEDNELYRGIDIKNPRLIKPANNELLFAFSENGTLSFDGSVPIFNSATLENIGSLQVTGDISALAITNDGSRALVAHTNDLTNASTSTSTHSNIHDVHIFDLRQSGYPELGSYELPGAVSSDGLIATSDNKIVAKIVDGNNTNIVFLIP